MKYLLIMMLALAGCCDKETGKKSSRSEESNYYPKFALDQEVNIVTGFYRGKAGKISSWMPCNDRDTHEQTVCYVITTPEGKDLQVNQKDVR
jgi:hypothetical protein